MKRFLVAAIVIGAFAMLPLATSGASAGTDMKFQPRVGKIYGLVAPSNGQLSNNAPASGSLYYNGGPVMTTSNVVHDLLGAVGLPRSRAATSTT